MEKPSKISVCTRICYMFFLLAFEIRIGKQTIRLFNNRKINTENLIKVLCLPLEFIAQREQTKDIYRMSCRKCLLVCIQKRKKMLKVNLSDITLAKSEEKKTNTNSSSFSWSLKKKTFFLDVKKNIIKKQSKIRQI